MVRVDEAFFTVTVVAIEEEFNVVRLELDGVDAFSDEIVVTPDDSTVVADDEFKPV